MLPEVGNINPDNIFIVVVLCDKKKGMAIVKSEVLEDTMDKIMPDGK